VEKELSQGGPIVLTALLEVIFEIIAEAVFEIMGDLVWNSLRNELDKREGTGHVLAALGFILLGSVAGMASAAIIPDRLTPVVLMPGLSLLLAPLGTGTVMHLYGRWRQERGHDISNLATFWGGATMALGMALIRYILVR
jgi:hypothetical protein